MLGEGMLLWLAEQLDDDHDVPDLRRSVRCPVCGFLVGQVPGRWVHVPTDREADAIEAWLGDRQHGI